MMVQNNKTTSLPMPPMSCVMYTGVQIVTANFTLPMAMVNITAIITT